MLNVGGVATLVVVVDVDSLVVGGGTRESGDGSCLAGDCFVGDGFDGRPLDRTFCKRAGDRGASGSSCLSFLRDKGAVEGDNGEVFVVGDCGGQVGTPGLRGNGSAGGGDVVPVADARKRRTPPPNPFMAAGNKRLMGHHSRTATYLNAPEN